MAEQVVKPLTQLFCWHDISPLEQLWSGISGFVQVCWLQHHSIKSQTQLLSNTGRGFCGNKNHLSVPECFCGSYPSHCDSEEDSTRRRSFSVHNFSKEVHRRFAW
jgi:hypothetical protein